MKKAGFWPLLVLGTLVAGCSSHQVAAIGVSAAIYGTRPKEPPPANVADQIPPHESWCYRTMADTECYTRAQDVPPSRLVNVEPQSLYPLTPEDYRNEVAGKGVQRPATAAPVTLGVVEETPGSETATQEPFWNGKLLGYQIL